ncbi:MAG: CHRD domain-containing protein [Deltaproteobacteria bacterium]|nr:CHRD domain-containing protein [Deltaproteobacteria bacterium]
MTRTLSTRLITCFVFGGFASTLTMACSDDDKTTSETYKEIAPLSVGVEVPPPTGTTTASGIFAFELNEKTGVMTYTLTLTDLTGPASAAHIHKGAPGVAGPVVLPLVVPASADPSTGTVTLDPAALADLKAGSLYVNAHTAANPMGEVRGQLKAHND